jgi:hypothetical protein
MEFLKAMQEIMARLEAKIKSIQTKMEVNLKGMKEEMLAKMKARIEANMEKSEVLQRTLVSQMDILVHQEKMKAMIPLWEPPILSQALANHSIETIHC